MIRLIAILILIIVALGYSVASVAILAVYKIQSLSYWTFWIWNTLALGFGFSTTIITKFVPSIRNDWITQELLMNISMILIVLSNLFSFILTSINFATQFYDGGLWKEKEEGLIAYKNLLTIYILTFCAFLVNLPPYVAILYDSRMVHLHYRARRRETWLSTEQSLPLTWKLAIKYFNISDLLYRNNFRPVRHLHTNVQYQLAHVWFVTLRERVRYEFIWSPVTSS